MTTLPFKTLDQNTQSSMHRGAFAGAVIPDENQTTDPSITSYAPSPGKFESVSNSTAVEEREPSTFDNGGWCPWSDGRDHVGRSFTEWVEACNDIELGRELRPPVDPRFRGLFPPGHRKQPVADAPDAKRLVLANGKPVVRLDTYARKPSRKTRAKNVAKQGTSYVRAKDIIVLEWINAWGSLTRPQLALFLGVKPNSLVRRLAKLTNMALLVCGKSLEGLATYSVTRAGRRLIGAEAWTTQKQSILRYDHTQACIEAATWITRLNPGGVVISEREVQHAGFDPDGRIGGGGDLGPRLKRQAPWLTEQVGLDFSLWSPPIRNSSGVTQGRKRPDLLLAIQGKPTIVIEVELNEKKPADYADMIRAYAEAQSEGHLGTVVYLVSNVAPLSSKRLRVLLDRALSLAHLPQGITVDIKVQKIPESVWVPLAVQLRG